MDTRLQPSLLPIHCAPERSICYNFSELNLIHIPEQHFKRSSGNDALDNYAEDCIVTALQYLVLQDLLRCRMVLRPYRLFKITWFRRMAYDLVLNEDATIDYPAFSWLEQCIFTAIKEERGYGLKYLVTILFDLLLDRGRYYSPGIELVARIIDHQHRLVATMQTSKRRWHGEEVSIDFPGQVQTDAVRRIRARIDEELLTNPGFTQFSKRLRWKVSVALGWRRESSD